MHGGIKRAIGGDLILPLFRERICDGARSGSSRAGVHVLRDKKRDRGRSYPPPFPRTNMGHHEQVCMYVEREGWREGGREREREREGGREGGREKERPSAFIAAAPPVSCRHALPRMRNLQIPGSYRTGIRPSFVFRFLPFQSPSSLDTVVPRFRRLPPPIRVSALNPRLCPFLSFFPSCSVFFPYCFLCLFSVGPIVCRLLLPPSCSSTSPTVQARP